MSPKTMRRTLQSIGFITGLIFGYFRPSHMQDLLPVLAIGVGISYFIYSSMQSEDDSDEEVVWFPFVQMMMYFLIGGVLSSSILLALEMRQLQ
ncbi:hypothetical protein AB4027_10060 [Alkalibacterium putridalgicola]|uniref:hypothetical protein n=1 Tax=Alkalibacterium putridalgicola TaxID=426703 RepID=UPI0034CDFA21